MSDTAAQLQRISTTSALVAPSHAASAVMAGSPRSIASARQARSPSDKPLERVAGRNSPQSVACASVNGANSIFNANNVARASGPHFPRSDSLEAVSARLTVDITAPSIAARTASAPGSDKINARRAELSKTYLLTLGFRVPFGNQLIDQRNALWNASPEEILSSANPSIDRLEDQGAINDARHQPISSQKTEFAAQRLRDRQSAIFSKGDDRGRFLKCIDIAHGRAVYHGNETAPIRAEMAATLATAISRSPARPRIVQSEGLNSTVFHHSSALGGGLIPQRRRSRLIALRCRLDRRQIQGTVDNPRGQLISVLKAKFLAHFGGNDKASLRIDIHDHHSRRHDAHSCPAAFI